LDVNALLAAEGQTLFPVEEPSPVSLVDVVSTRSFPVPTPLCRFGRDISNDIVLSGDKSLSRFHFQITMQDGGYLIEDAGSRNGSFLNGSPITSPRKIVAGDIISAGMARYRFTIQGEEGEDVPITETISDKAEETPQKESAAPATSETIAAPKPAVPVASSAPAVDPLAKLVEEGQQAMAAYSAADELDSLFKDPAKDNGNKTLAESMGEAPSNEIDKAVDDLFDQQFAAAPQAAKVETPQPTATAAPTSTAASTTASTAASGESESWPAWCKDFELPELGSIKNQVAEIQQQIKESQHKLSQLEDNAKIADSIKNRLLAGKEEQVKQASTQVFQQLGWSSKEYSQEMVLSSENSAVALMRVVFTDSEPKPAELASLVSSQSNYWSEHKVEPKAILLLATLKDGPPAERQDCSKDFSDYAARKNVCVISTLQLLSIYREAVLGNGDKQGIKDAILNANGQLSGFNLEVQKPQPVS
jgi:hypothetical protein